MRARFGGTSWGPDYTAGGYLDLDSADLGTVVRTVTAAANAVREQIPAFGTAVAGALAIGMVASALANTRRTSIGEGPVLGTAGRRRFEGFALDESIVVECDGHRLTPSLTAVREIFVRQGFFLPIRRMTIKMMDGSRYEAVKWIGPDELRFQTTAGPQSVRFRRRALFGYREDASLRGTWTAQEDALRTRLKTVVATHARTAAAEIQRLGGDVPAALKLLLPPT